MGFSAMVFSLKNTEILQNDTVKISLVKQSRKQTTTLCNQSTNENLNSTGKQLHVVIDCFGGH